MHHGSASVQKGEVLLVEVTREVREVALRRARDPVVVGACLAFLDLCAIPRAPLAIDAAALRRVLHAAAPDSRPTVLLIWWVGGSARARACVCLYVCVYGIPQRSSIATLTCVDMQVAVSV
jgi:hypothetical protein